MKDSQINKITNVLGLVFWGLSIYEYFNGKDIKVMVSLLLIGAVLLYIKSSESRKWLLKYLEKK